MASLAAVKPPPGTRIRVIAAAAALAAALAGCTSTVTGTAPPATGSAPASGALPSSVQPISGQPAPVPVSDPGRVTGTLIPPHAAGGCHALGTVPYQLPDPACTPGSFDPTITAARLCAPDYTTGPYRPPATGTRGTTRFKYDQAYPAYGIPAGTKTELDHLINLDLAGSNDAANLWPETGPVPNPKDTIENRLHNWVCGCPLNAYGYRPSCVLPADAQGRLESAQDAIAADWITALDVLGVPARHPGPAVTTPADESRTL